MLRITGILALILSSILLTVGSLGVRTVRASGHFYNSMDPNLRVLTSNWSTLHLETNGGTRNMFHAESAPAYPGSFGYVTNGDIVVNVYVAFPDLPRECDVEIVHRWIGAGGRFFGSTVLVYDGVSYPIERSPTVFFGTLLSVGLAPGICWGIAAMFGILLPRVARSAPRVD